MPLDQAVIESQEFKDTLAEAVNAATSPLQESISKLQSTNSELKTEKQQVAEKYNSFKEKYGGIDIEDYKAQQVRLAEIDNDETRAMLAKGEFDKVFEKQVAQLNADNEAKLEASNAQLEASSKTAEEYKAAADALKSTLVSTVREGGISQEFVTTGADKSQLRSVQAIARDTVLHKGERVPVVEVHTDGTSTFRNSITGEILQNQAGNFGFRDWLKHLAEVEEMPLYAKPNSHGAKNITDANPKGYVKSKMTPDEQQKFKTEHGIPAYNALPYS